MLSCCDLKSPTHVSTCYLAVKIVIISLNDIGEADITEDRPLCVEYMYEFPE